jgi:hypothetical protein
MGTVKDFLKGQAMAVGSQLGGLSHHAENVLDFSDINVSSGDVVQALKIPKNALVKNVWSKVITAEGGAATVNVGDEDDADGWDAAVNVNAEAGIIKGDGALAGGKHYTAEDTIDLVPSADLDTAKVLVVAEYTILEQV